MHTVRALHSALAPRTHAPRLVLIRVCENILDNIEIDLIINPAPNPIQKRKPKEKGFYAFTNSETGLFFGILSTLGVIKIRDQIDIAEPLSQLTGASKTYLSKNTKESTKIKQLKKANVQKVISLVEGKNGLLERLYKIKDDLPNDITND